MHVRNQAGGFSVLAGSLMSNRLADLLHIRTQIYAYVNSRHTTITNYYIHIIQAATVKTIRSHTKNTDLIISTFKQNIHLVMTLSL
jgi:hypothetical protein